MATSDIMGAMLIPEREKIIRALGSYKIKQQPAYADLFSSDGFRKVRPSGFRPSAVFIPLLEHEDQWHLLLTHRSDRLNDHGGQVAFPGGARDETDRDLLDTALREMEEEIGVVPDDVVVFGDLGDMAVITGFCVKVFVGKIPWPYALRINPDEVESAFIVPLAWLADPHNRRHETHSHGGRELPVIFFGRYQGYQLWGASADMTLALLEALGLA